MPKEEKDCLFRVIKDDVMSCVTKLKEVVEELEYVIEDMDRGHEGEIELSVPARKLLFRMDQWDS